MADIKDHLRRGGPFMRARDDYGTARAVLFGAPMDYTASFRPGSRLAPQQIRAVSFGLEEYSPHLERELGQVPFYDAGDLELPHGNVAARLNLVQDLAAAVAEAGKIPVMLGGEHLVSWPAIAALYARYPDLAVLHWDAHADMRAQYEGERYSHATVMRLVADRLGGGNLYQCGIRSGAREEWAYAAGHTHIFPYEVAAPLRQVLPALRHRPVYVTLDIDVVDPAFAPGTGTPEPGGVSSGEIIQAVHLLAGLRLVGFDLVEVAPVYDQSERTSLLAAKIIRELLLLPQD